MKLSDKLSPYAFIFGAYFALHKLGALDEVLLETFQINIHLFERLPKVALIMFLGTMAVIFVAKRLGK